MLCSHVKRNRGMETCNSAGSIPCQERSPIRTGMDISRIAYHCYRQTGETGQILVDIAWFVRPFCFVNSCPVKTTILMILITTYTAFRVMVQRTEMSATLIITDLGSDDDGIYECRDTTNDGGESGTIRLILYGKISESAFIVNVIHVIWSDIRPCTVKPG